MPARTGKDTPVGIASHVVVLPALLVGVVQSLGYVFVAWFRVEYGFDGFVSPCRVHIHPVVLLCIVGYGIILVPHTLAILAMSALEGMEVQPLGLAPPFGRGIASARMIGHEVVVVYGLDGCGKRLPHLGVHITGDVTAHNPDDVGRVLVAFGEELAVCLGLGSVYLLRLYLRTPHGNHTDVDAVLLCQLDDIVEMIPVAVHALRVGFCHVPSGWQRRLSVYVVCRCVVHHLHQHRIESCRTAFLQIVLCLCPVEAFGQKPSRIAKQEERRPVCRLQETLVG